MTSNNISVILLAGGKGSRMKAPVPKQFLSINGKLIAHYSLDVFLSIPEIKEVIVVCSADYQYHFSDYAVKIAPPGERRQDSVFNGLQHVSESAEWICIHDAARPLIDRELVLRLIAEGKKAGAATVGMPVKWTVKQSAKDNFVQKTLNREKIWEIQTPQLLLRSLLEKGFQIASENQLTVTDDVSLAELIPHPVKLVEGSYINLKLTTPEDIVVAEQLLKLHPLAKKAI